MPLSKTPMSWYKSPSSDIVSAQCSPIDNMTLRTNDNVRILRNWVRVDIAAINVEFAIYQSSLMTIATAEVLDWVLWCL